MPKVRMLRNLGVEDARILELDPREAREGREIEVSEDQAEELVRCSFGEMVEESPKPPQHKQDKPPQHHPDKK